MMLKICDIKHLDSGQRKLLILVILMQEHYIKGLVKCL